MNYVSENVLNFQLKDKIQLVIIVFRSDLTEALKDSSKYNLLQAYLIHKVAINIYYSYRTNQMIKN